MNMTWKNKQNVYLGVDNFIFTPVIVIVLMLMKNIVLRNSVQYQIK